jgi:hypothetical protein
MRTSWFGRLLVFVLVLVALRLFFHWNISIVGSLVVTLIVYLIMSAFESGGRSGQVSSRQAGREPGFRLPMALKVRTRKKRMIGVTAMVAEPEILAW